jgi:hypothetical protein
MICFIIGIGVILICHAANEDRILEKERIEVSIIDSKKYKEKHTAFSIGFIDLGFQSMDDIGGYFWPVSIFSGYIVIAIIY